MKENLEKNLRKLQSEILRIKLSKGSMGLIQQLQLEYDKLEKELNVLRKSKDKEDMDGHDLQQLHQGES